MRLVDRVQRWRYRREVHTLINDHAKWTGLSIGLIEQTNPTLGGVTFERAKAMMIAEPLPRNSHEFAVRLETVIELVQAALDQERRRLGRS